MPSLGDVALTFAVYGVCALAAGRWHLAGTWNEYAAAALLGGACAVAYEWKALASGWWSYSDRMPIVPLLGVGLWPLLQLTLLVPVAFWPMQQVADHQAAQKYACQYQPNTQN